ncbi:MAG: hypothetical protein PW734_07110 [Verrucomicrobium sp.]|nr:hypothetical protein [Verrucomicrobium sp.]
MGSPLVLNPARIYDDPIFIQQQLPPEVIDIQDSAVRSKGPVQVDLTIQRDGESLIVTGKVGTVLSTQCGRCADWIDWPVQIDEFIHLLEAPLPDSVDLTPLVREDILLDLPVVTACRLTPDRKCPISGKTYPEAGETPSPIHGADVWKELDNI